MSGVYLWRDKDHTRAIAAGEKALTLDPNGADSYVELAGVLSYVGRTDEAVALLRKAMRLNPQYPSCYLFALGHVYHAAWKNEDAVTVLQRFVAQNPDFSLSRWQERSAWADSDEATHHIENLRKLGLR